MLLEYDLRPVYYDKFQCLAGNCCFICCKGWRITFDRKDFMALKLSPACEGVPALPKRIMLMGLSLKSLADGETRLERWMDRAELLSEQAAELPLSIGRDPALIKFLANNIRFIHEFCADQGDFFGLQQELTGIQDTGVTAEGQRKSAFSTAPYLSARSRYETRFGNREYFMENLMVSLLFQLKFPELDSLESLWISYVSFCNLYKFIPLLGCHVLPGWGRRRPG